METSMASCTDTREQTYLNKQRVGTGPAVVDGQYTLAAVDKFAEDLAQDILKEAERNPLKIAVNRYGEKFYEAVDYLNGDFKNQIGSNAGEALRGRWEAGNITNLETADFMQAYNYTAEGLLDQTDTAKLNLQLNNYLTGGISESIIGGFCNQFKNFFNQIDAFWDLVGQIDALIQSVGNFLGKIPRDYEGIKSLVVDQIIDKLIKEIKEKVLNVIEKVYEDIMAAIENFDPAKIIGDAVTNINRMHTKRVMTIKERLCNDMTEEEKKKLKNKVKGFIDYTVSLFETIDLEAIQFLVYRFCALATNIEALIKDIKNPLDSFGNRYQRIVQRMQTISRQNTSTAVRNGAIRFSEEERRTQINNLKGVWEGGDDNEVKRKLRTPTGEDAILVKEPTAQEYKDLPACMKVWKGESPVWTIDKSKASFENPSDDGETGGVGLRGYTHIDLDVKVFLHRLQKKLDGKNITITKGWVSKDFNERVKGSPDSSHLTGLVVDIKNDFDLGTEEQIDEFKRRVFAAGFKYVVIYDKHIHLDIRDIPR